MVGLQDFFTLSLSIIIGSLPFVVLGTVLSVVIQNYVPQDKLLRFLPKNSFLRRLVLSFMGIFLPVCECGNIPLARGLMIRGVSPADATVFLLAAPIVNPITIITTYQVFHFSGGILVARILGGFLIAHIIAVMLTWQKQQSRLLTKEMNYSCSHNHENNSKENKFSVSVKDFSSEFMKMFKPLVVGAMIAGLIQVIVPKDILSSVGSDPILSIVVMLVLACVISICSTVDSFFALAFSSTFSSGAITAFLLAGPLVDIRMISMLKTTYTTKTIILIVVSVLILSFIIGEVVNLFG